MDNSKNINDVISSIAINHGRNLKRAFKETINKKNIKVSNVLANSLSPNITIENNSVVLSYNFVGYGRALEIRFHRKEITSSTNVEKRLRKELNNARGIKNKKNVDWYSKNAYKSLGTLYSTVSYGIMNQIISSAKNIQK